LSTTAFAGIKHIAFYHCFVDLPMQEDDLLVFIDPSCINGIKVEGRKKIGP